MSNIMACMFTGYRPQKFSFNFSEDDKDYLEFENELMDSIIAIYDAGAKRFYCGCAMGFDLLAAEIVLLLKERNPEIELYCFVPFEGQEKTFTSYWKEKYKLVLNGADDIKILCEHYYKGCYQQRNQEMVNNSSIVLTYFDGQSGGTGQTIKYAQKKGLKIINIAEGLGRLEKESLNLTQLTLY